MQTGDRVYFQVSSQVGVLTLSGRVVRVNPDGTLLLISSSGLIRQNVDPNDVWMDEDKGASDLSRSVASA